MEARRGRRGQKKAKSRLMGLKTKRDRNALGSLRHSVACWGVSLQLHSLEVHPRVSPKEKGNLCLRGADHLFGWAAKAWMNSKPFKIVLDSG